MIKVITDRAKAGEWVKIVDMGKAYSRNFTQGKEYHLSRDLTEDCFFVHEDDNGSMNGWSSNLKNLNMKFEKCPAPAEEISMINNLYPLFKYMHEEHGLKLLDSELRDVIEIVNSIQKESVEEENQDRIPFDLEKWKTGKYDVISREGVSVDILKTDLKANETLVVVYHFGDNEEHAYAITEDGMFHSSEDPHENDLFLTPKTTKVWVNVYHGRVEWISKEDAYDNRDQLSETKKYIETIEVIKPVK